MPPGPRSLTEAGYDRVVAWLDRVAEDGLLRIFGRGLGRRVRAIFGQQMVQRKLLPTETVVAEVMHSGIRYVPSVLIVALGVFLVVRWLPFVPTRSLAFAAVISFGILLFGIYKVLYVARDRFVLTDSRVFRVYGVESLREAEMELGRVLDITVDRPFWLRPFRSGHLVLENAAQQQGLKDIRYIPRPEILAKEIHRLRRESNTATRARIMAAIGTVRRAPADHPARRVPRGRVARPHGRRPGPRRH